MGQLTLNKIDYQVITTLEEDIKEVRYLISDKQTNKKKILKAIKIKEKSLKLQKETESLMNLSHESIVKILEVTHIQKSENYTISIVFEYLELQNLKSYLGKLYQNQIIKIYEQLKQVILYIHSKDLVNRQIKLEKILVDNNLNVKLSDFSLSIPQYQKYGKQYDDYCLGIILIELVTGKSIGNKHIKIINQIKKQGNIQKFNIKGQFKPIIQKLFQIKFKEQQIRKNNHLNKIKFRKNSIKIISPSSPQPDYLNQSKPKRKGIRIIRSNTANKEIKKQIKIKKRPIIQDIISMNPQIKDKFDKKLNKIIAKDSRPQLGPIKIIEKDKSDKELNKIIAKDSRPQLEPIKIIQKGQKQNIQLVGSTNEILKYQLKTHSNLHEWQYKGLNPNLQIESNIMRKP